MDDDNEMEFEEGIETEEEDPSLQDLIEDEEEESDEDKDAIFYSNLVSVLEKPDLTTIAEELLELIEGDTKAREGRDKQYEEGIRRTGLSNDAPGGANFSGASKVVHPGLVVAGLEFASRVIPEFFPPEGPVRMEIIPNSNSERVAKAFRKSKHMNWQLNYKCPEFRTVFESMISQLPFGGSQYVKLMWNAREGRPFFEFVPIDRVIIPYHSNNFYTSHRITHIQDLSKNEFESRVEDGVYEVTAEIVDSGDDQMQFSFSQEARDRVEGKEYLAAYSRDGLRRVYEINVLWRMPWDDAAYPYLVTVDEATRSVIAIYRNWERDDDRVIRIHHIFDFTFIPWSGAQGIGLPHIIGGMSAAATGALRSLLDSAHVNNSLTLLKLKGANFTGQNTTANPGETVEVEGAMGVDDIRKVLTPVPFNPPSPALMELLGFLTGQIQSAVKTSLDETPADSNANTPVGTQLSRVEQGLKVFSSIHARIHNSMKMLLSGVHRLNKIHVEEEEIENDVGEVLAYKADYNGPADVIPVSDPRIFSHQQRIAQAQILAGRAASMPMLYDLRKVEAKFLETMQIENGEDMLIPIPTPRKINSVNENVAMASGSPVVAFPDQDHLAHIQTHTAFALHPLLGSNPILAPKVIPSTLNHITQHVLMYYVETMESVASSATGMDISEIMKGITEIDDQSLENQLDVLFATSAKTVGETLMSALAQVKPVLDYLHQTAQSLKPPMPMDPTIVAMEEVKSKERIENKRIENKTQVDAANMQLAAKKHEDTHEDKVENTQIKAMDVAIKGQVAKTTAETGLIKVITDAETSDMDRDANVQKADRDRAANMDKADADRATDERKSDLDRATNERKSDLDRATNERKSDLDRESKAAESRESKD